LRAKHIREGKERSVSTLRSAITIATMSREIRRVAPDWQHPMTGGASQRDSYKPLLDGYAEDKASFEADPEDRDDERPDPSKYMPDWTPEEATAYQVYETSSEGTPVSPVLPDRDALIHWLTTDGSGMGIGGRRMPLTPEQAEKFAERTYAPSIIATGGYFGSGLTTPEE